MFELSMEGKSKGIAWVGNIYQKFEAMCLEMDDMVCQETFQYVEDQLQTVGANVKQFCTELMQEVLPSSPTNPKEDLNTSLVQNADVAHEDSNSSVDKERIKKKLIHASSVEYVEDTHLCLSSEHCAENECALAQTCKTEALGIDCTPDDTVLESKEEASHKSVPKLELEAVPVPSFNKVKLEESCIIVDSSELYSLSNELRERRSFKKKFRESFSSKSRLLKLYNERHPRPSKEKGNSHELFSDTTKSKSQEVGFSESDWEII
ncbi:Detected protein of unknown function [Hibiscus syriacus]|uniref:Uncharacterized protein n=1 Tax=Hibiscus syriacus TaxID=106335 RepID=A0A6A2ZDG7_HIBSY|nr:uncharacterized protein LOC120147343 [Hibiscus syriacus]XP_039016674.1 uncharacterized protein LOC120147343 [Hibiscus syriacus]XP_039016675.1 uncharacterized protein LOC120147343 [Hibiscus syriacus]KAE8689449.1 Detected protein of unknown function [Hibiscus syriacus]